MSWLPVSLEGFRRIGFIRTSGSFPAASACTACARPISSPSGVMWLFKAIFWLLNGAVRNPSSRKIRQSAVTRRLLPAPDMVPWTMMHFAVIRTSQAL